MTDAGENLHAYGVHLGPNLNLNMYRSGNCFQSCREELNT